MNQTKGLWRYRFTRIFGMATFLAMLLSLVGLPLSHPGIAAYAAAPSGCTLNSAKGAIQHVIYIQFDNTHFTRDNPNIPSDLEQMPHLLNFILSNGVMLSNYHTPLISHTAPDILTSMTGLYGAHDGMPIGNSYRYFNANGTSSSATSFT